jgi:hypothetical protein
MSDLPALPHTPLGRYRHYKGGEYEVVVADLHCAAMVDPDDLELRV